MPFRHVHAAITVKGSIVSGFWKSEKIFFELFNKKCEKRKKNLMRCVLLLLIFCYGWLISLFGIHELEKPRIEWKRRSILDGSCIIHHNVCVCCANEFKNVSNVVDNKLEWCDFSRCLPWKRFTEYALFVSCVLFGSIACGKVIYEYNYVLCYTAWL